MGRKIIVIGAGAAGMHAASTARAKSKDAEVTVFTEDEHIAYSPCAIPFVLEGKIKNFESIVMHTPDFYQKERNITVHTKTKVTGVDMDKKTVTTQDGKQYSYDAIVVATGGTVFIPPVEGSKLPGVFTVRTVNDGKAIQKAMKGAKSVVVAGAGVIGLEMAVGLKHAGLDVTVIEMFPQVIPRIFDSDMAAMVQEYCEKVGIKFVLNVPIGAIKGEGKVEKVVAGNVEYPCDFVIMSTGVRANLEIPNMMGLDVGALGAVRTSPTLQAYKKGRLVKDVYLCGDVIMCESAVVPGPTMSQLGSSALRQGRVAGINAAGGYAYYPGVASAFISRIGELEAGGTGLSRGLADYYGLNYVEGKASGLTRARYYPGGKKITVKMLVDKDSHKILGSQIVGGEEITGRVNWVTAAIIKGVTVEEFVTALENAYCPPTSMVMDIVNIAAEDAASKL
ncbi:MAG: FAD-dependent oxidoreductase [Methanomassiliicoccales archaeon]|nr:FAD-dependent oxidoreductase [Methanomassiliicoccales archaeon]